MGSLLPASLSGGGRCIYRKDPYVLEFTGLSELAKYSETDLVFFNRLLRCFVQMYVNYYDGTVKLKDENPTKGILLCKNRNDTVAEMTFNLLLQ